MPNNQLSCQVTFRSKVSCEYGKEAIMVRLGTWNRESQTVIADVDSTNKFITGAAQFVADRGVDETIIVPNEIPVGDSRLFMDQVSERTENIDPAPFNDANATG